MEKQLDNWLFWCHTCLSEVFLLLALSFPWVPHKKLTNVLLRQIRCLSKTAASKQPRHSLVLGVVDFASVTRWKLERLMFVGKTEIQRV